MNIIQDHLNGSFMHYFKSLKISKTHSERSKERNCTQPKCRVKSFKHTTYISSILLNSLPINERVNTQLLTGGNWHSSKCGSQTDDPTNQEESRGGSEVCTCTCEYRPGQFSLAFPFSLFSKAECSSYWRKFTEHLCVPCTF